MADPSNNDFHHVFGRQDWQQQQQHQQPQQAQQPPQPQSPAEEPSQGKGKKRSAAAVAGAAEDDQEEGAGGQAMVFPVKLHRMLTQIDEKANTDPQDSTTSRTSSTPTSDDSRIISWQPHGRCFLVHDKEAFVQRFLPSYFRQSKWASFQRQLNIYGFQRLTAGRDRGAYYHDLFLRGHPELATRIHRMKLKGIGQGRHRTNAELEPNFYRMKPVGAGDQIDATVIGMQPNASAAAVAYASGQPAAASAPTAVVAATPQAPTSTVNVLQLFGGGNAAGQATTIPVVANTADLNNIFFLTSGNELASLQNIGSVAMATGGAATAVRDSSDSGRTTHQEGLQSAQHLNLLANLFNAANTNNSVTVAGTGEAQASHSSRTSTEERTSTAADDLSQWSSSNLFGGNSNLALLQNPDANLLTTATLMQYMGDSNSPVDGAGTTQAPTDPTGVASASGTPAAARSTSQSPWTALATAGFHSVDASNTTSASGSRGNTLAASSSSNDLVNTFRLDGPSLRRMSAAAMSSLLNANSSSSPSASNIAGNPFDSNPNLLLFSTLHQSRNASSSQMENTDPAAALTASEALNRLAAAQHPSTRDTTNSMTTTAAAASSSATAGAPGPAPTPASQQLAYINAAAAAAAGGGGGGNTSVAQAPSNSQSAFLFGDLLSGRTATAASQPTFLDSVYEPIPIKENANANSEAATAASGSGQQHKLSPRATGASADPTQGGGGRSGFHHLPSDRQG